jgi:predicted ATP-dependent endonuclease of OLD family
MSDEVKFEDLEFHNFYEYLPVPDSLKGKLLDKDEKVLTDIEYLNKINIFIGENNSGKSYILREIIKATKANVNNENFFNNIKKLINDKLEEISAKAFVQFSEYSPQKINFTFKNDKSNAFNIKEFLKLVNSSQNIIKSIEKLITLTNSQLKNILILENDNIKKTINSNDNGIINKYENYFNEVKKKLNEMFDYNFLNKMYIHNLRSTYKEYFLEDFNLKIVNEYEINRHIDTYENHEIKFKQKEKNSEIEIITGHDIFGKLRKGLLNKHQTRKNHLEFEEFLSNKFFNNSIVSISPSEDYSNIKSEKDHLRIKIGNQTERPIYELGTGLQMIILLTYPLFNFESGMIFIEEPELYLHPKLQRKLIEVYTTHPRSKNFQFYIATHSNHIIDTFEFSDKVSVFTVEKKEDENEKEENKKQRFIIEKVCSESTKALDLIGVRYSSLKAANCIIWVEGPSDRIYINKMIELRNPDLKEGFHYQIMFYGGSLIKHIEVRDLFEDIQENFEDEVEIDDVQRLINLIRINKNIIFVADRDTEKQDEPLKENLQRIKHEIEDEECLWITDEREIEHYFMDLINKVLENKGKSNRLDNSKAFAELNYNKVDFAKKLVNSEDFAKFINELENETPLSIKINNLIEMIKKFNDMKEKKDK